VTSIDGTEYVVSPLDGVNEVLFGREQTAPPDTFDMKVAAEPTARIAGR
jgi:hypothetical protein